MKYVLIMVSLPISPQTHLLLYLSNSLIYSSLSLEKKQADISNKYEFKNSISCRHRIFS